MQYNCVVTGQVIGRIRTQRAGLSGVARSHLALLEAGIKNVGVDALCRIAAAVDMRQTDLVKIIEKEYDRVAR